MGIRLKLLIPSRSLKFLEPITELIQIFGRKMLHRFFDFFYRCHVRFIELNPYFFKAHS